MCRIRPEDLARAHPERDFVVAEGEISSRYMVDVHKAFYRFVADRVTGLVVLDAGCGTALGSHILSQRAAHTVAVDIKPLLLRYGRQEYGRDRLSFAAMDVGWLALADRSFDAIVVDELLEHLPDHRPFLIEALRVLKPGGLFICATVNGAHTFGTGEAPRNRNHFREYEAETFREELLRYFGQVEILGQEVGPGFARYLQNRWARALEWILVRLNLKHHLPAELRVKVRSSLAGASPHGQEFLVTERNVEDSLYLVAVARGAAAARPAEREPLTAQQLREAG